MTTPRRDVYEETTARIIAALDAGVVPWVRPWSITAAHAGPDRNALTGRPYNGVNVMLLWLTRHERGYDSPLWLTFRQALQLGGHVRRGEKGTTITFWNSSTVAAAAANSDDAEPDEKRIVWARAYTVFNVAQCDGLPDRIASAVVAEEGGGNDDGIDHCEAFVAATGATIRHSGSRAFYRTSDDTIHVPALTSFESREHYYATLFHELVHWTGNESRCDRQLKNRFGDDAYAAEELIAELGSAFLCAEHGIAGQLRHASYLDHWLRVLRADKRAIFTAASKARTAVEFLLADPELSAAA